MKKIIEGTAFVFGNNIDTDQIYPGRYLELVEAAEIAKHCLEGADPEFLNHMSPGDLVVAGTNFGCGSSREQAPIALINAGVSMVLAESFARIFFRNAINLALPLMVCPGIRQQVTDGDVLRVEIEQGIVYNLTQNTEIRGEKISDYTMNILNHGGIKPLFRRKYCK